MMRKEHVMTATYTEHGDCGSQLYTMWANIKQRCTNPKRPDYKWYGAKGITVYYKWLTYPRFKAWAECNGFKKGLTIDRIDSNLNYEPSNCQFITFVENIRKSPNKKKLSEDQMREAILLYDTGLPQWKVGKEFGVSQMTIHYILKDRHKLFERKEL